MPRDSVVHRFLNSSNAGLIRGTHINFAPGIVRHNISTLASPDDARVESYTGYGTIEGLKQLDLISQFKNGTASQVGLDARVRGSPAHLYPVLAATLARGDYCVLLATRFKDHYRVVLVRQFYQQRFTAR